MKKPGIIYFFDPLCLTCFSFAPVLNKIREAFSDQIEFDLVTGGMVTGGRVGPVAQKADYLKKKIAALENTTGVKFGEPFFALLEKGEYISDSTPPSVAFQVLRTLRPELKFKFGHMIQGMHYVNGHDLNRMRPYFDICEHFGINKRAFLDRYEDPVFEKMTRDAFEFAGSNGIEQFPSLCSEIKGQLNLIIKGYEPYEVIEKKLLEMLKNAV